METDQIRYRNRLREARKSRGLTQQAVAEEIGTTALTINRWEQGKSFPQPYYLQKLCKFFSLTAEELGLTREKHSNNNENSGTVEETRDATSSVEELGFIGNESKVVVAISPQMLLQEKTVVEPRLSAQALSSLIPFYILLIVCGICIGAIILSVLGQIPSSVGEIITGLGFLIGLIAAILQLGRGLIHHSWRKAGAWHRRSVLVIGMITVVLLAGSPFLIRSLSSSQSPASSSVGKPLYANHLYSGYYVNNIAWSPNGEYIASADGDHTVQIINSTNGSVVYTYRGHSSYVNDVAWSPDGNRIASASADGTVQVWDAITGDNVYTYRGHVGSVYDVAWSPNGKYIASSGHDGIVRIWDATTDRTLYSYRGHSGGVWAVAWSPDGNRIASASADGTVQVWDAITGDNVYTYRGHVGSVYDVAWSPDGNRIASVGQDATVQVWNPVNGSIFQVYRGHSSPVQAVAWSPDGKYIASGGLDGTVRIWNATTSSIYVYRGHTNGVYSVAWSPDGKYIASGGLDGSIQVWQAV